MVQLEVFLSRLSERSATFEDRLRRESTLLATASIKVAVMHLDRFASVNFPDAIETTLAAYLEQDADIPELGRLRG